MPRLALPPFINTVYRSCWHIIKDDAMVAISAVWRRDFRNLRLLNTAYIALLSKKEGASETKDFRFISLEFCKTGHQVIGHWLASRLHYFFSPNQCAFIKWRFVIASCWYNKWPDFFAPGSSLAFFSSLMSLKLLTLSVGLSSLRCWRSSALA